VSTMRFEFATAGRILFGAGRIAELGTEVASLGTRPMFVSSGVEGPAGRALESLAAAGANPVATLEVKAEPSVELAREGAAIARQTHADVVVAVGGGSAIDTAKAIAALAVNEGDPLDYLEVVGRGQALTRPSLPCVAVPTTAGTGAEVTRNAVLRANALTDGLCREAIPRSARSLRLAFERGGDAAAREDLALASLFGGLALANAGLGAVHGFAAPIGGSYPSAPHGAVCGRLLPIVMDVILHALRERAADGPVLARFDETARLLTGDVDAPAEAGVEWIAALVADLGMPGLATYGIAEDGLDALVGAARKASSMRANPIELMDAELRTILERAL
jgi:alcohol dehydrogenase class IV